MRDARELEIALQHSRSCGLRLWERADHLQKTMKEIVKLTNDPLIIHMAEKALLHKSDTL